MRLHFTLLLLLCSSSLWAQIPQLLSQMIEKYPTEYRRVWYCFDIEDGKRYYRTQFSAPRNKISAADVSRLSESYLSAFNHTDFQKATGILYRSPDSTSVTIKGPEVLAFDLGPASVATDWGQETAASRKWTNPDFHPLTETFALISKGHRSKTTDVSYTGTWANTRYIFHRGQGKGITKGVRTTLYNVSPADYEKIRRVILQFIGKAVPVTVFDYTWQTMVKSESTPDFYIAGYNPATKVLNFMHATIEKEICIPIEWQTLDRLPAKSPSNNI